MDPELTEKRKKQAQNARELQTQMQQNKERREREKQNEERRREKEEADLNNYNPFGRGGAGAPLRNEYGDVQANLREVTREAPNPNGTRYDGPAPPVNDLLERPCPGTRRRPTRRRGRASARCSAVTSILTRSSSGRRST